MKINTWLAVVVPLITALGGQRQEDLCEFKIGLVFRGNSKTGSKATEKPQPPKRHTRQDFSVLKQLIDTFSNITE